MKCQIILLLILGITFSSCHKSKSTASHFRKRNHKNDDVCSWTKEKLEKNEIFLFNKAKEHIENKLNCVIRPKTIVEAFGFSYKKNIDQCNEIKENKSIMHQIKVLYKSYAVLCRKLGFEFN